MHSWIGRLARSLPIGAAIVLLVATPAAAQEDGLGTETDPVVVAIKEAEPFVILTGDGPRGYSIDVWDDLADRLGVTTRYEVVDTVDDQLAAVESGEADAAIGAISVTPDREESVDFTHPIYVTGQQVLVAANSDFAPEGVLGHLIGSGVFVLFGGLVVVTIVMGIILWLVERRKNPHFGGDGSRGALDGIWWSVVTLTTVGYGDKVPSSAFGRILSMVWILGGVVFLAVFTATVTTSLTVEELGGDIQSVDDLYGKEVVTVEETTGEDTLTDLHVAYDTVQDVEAGGHLVGSGGADAMVYDAPLVQFYAVTEGRGEVETVGDVFARDLYAVALPPDSPLLEPLNVALAEMTEDGVTDELIDQWFKRGG